MVSNSSELHQARKISSYIIIYKDCFNDPYYHSAKVSHTDFSCSSASSDNNLSIRLP